MKHTHFLSRHLFAGCGLSLAASLALTGCGGGGGNSSNGGGNNSGGGNNASVAQAVTSLQQLTVSNNGKTPTVQQLATNLTPVEQQFQTAATQNPNNPDALVGLAITQAAQAASTASGTLGAVTAGAGPAKAQASPRAARLSQLSQGLVIWNLPALFDAHSSAALPKAQDLLPTPLLTGASTGSPTPDQVAQAITQLDSGLAAAESSLTSALTQIGSNNNYAFGSSEPGGAVAIPVPDANGNVTNEYIGKAELQALGSVIAAVRALANVATAYSFDPAGFNFNAPLLTQFPASFTSTGGTLTPAQYLPQNAFLTLVPTGTLKTRTALSELQAVATDTTAGLQTISARLTAGSNSQYLLSGSAFTANQIPIYEGYVNSYSTDLSSAQTVSLPIAGQTYSVKLNIGGFLTNPPADLKPLAPTYQTSSNTNGTYTATLNLSGNPITATVDSSTTINDLLYQSAFFLYVSSMSAGGGTGAPGGPPSIGG